MTATAAEFEPQPVKWLMRVEGRDYGPYGIDQLKAFVAQHRFVPDSLVCEHGADGWRRAAEDPELSQLFGKPRVEDTDGVSTFVIYFDSKGYTPPDFEKTVDSFENAYRVASNLWLVQTTANVVGLRNDLTQKLGRHDTLLIVDAGKAKGAWHNFGPEVESKFRQLLKRR